VIEPLPIDAYLGAIVEAVRRSRALVLVAQPGAGKTTRVPPALAGDGRVVLLQPRRVAARAIARRIAEERGWTIGREIGWHVRFDRQFTADTRLLVATEGILTAMLQQDPLLSAFHAIIVDEFHERSIHADVALALARQAWLAREDLRLVVMSATIDAGPVSAFLADCPVFDIPGRLHPIDIGYAAGAPMADAAVELVNRTPGNILCFLPGAAEIDRACGELRRRVSPSIGVLPLHGSLRPDDQDRALAPGGTRRIVVATNLAETSLTVPGVTAVVDSGLHKVARYDADRAIDSLALERIPADAADQRAGRAGRLGPGLVLRLWDERDRLRRHREPEMHRIDLAGPVLDIIGWGADPSAFEWFDPPRADALEAALLLLDRLGAIRGRTLTDTGDRIRRLPVHPRLARMLIAAGGSRAAARACALLSERHYFPAGGTTTTSDLLSALDRWTEALPHVVKVATELERIAGRVIGDAPRTSGEADLRAAVLAGYPDRVAQRRQTGSPRLKLATGAGAVQTRESGVRDAEFLVALDVRASSNAADPDARVQLASAVDRDWLAPTHRAIEHRFDRDSGRVRAFEVEYYDALVLAERPIAVDPEISARMLASEWIVRAPRGDDERLLRRLAFAGRSIDLEALVRTAALGAAALGDVRLERAVPADVLRAMDREAPETITVPSGRAVKLEYAADGRVSAAVKLQELFGLAETPRIGTRRVPVVLELLAPNGRPVQVTTDLRSFWERTYPDVRKELRGRYPRHPWPDDPWTAIPTSRPTKRV